MKKILLALGNIAISGFVACSGGGGGSNNGGAVAITGVSLNKTSTNLLIGGTEQLTATITPSNATNQKVTWTSSDGSTVMVSADGLVSRTAFGTAKITVTTEDGSFTASCIVVVPIQRVSVNSDSTQGNDYSDTSSISADGRYVAFCSYASNLVDNDTNATRDVFVHDRLTHATERVSVSSTGTQGNYYSQAPSISADGRYVAFCSAATNLVDNDTNGQNDIFVHDRQTHTTERVSVSSTGTEANNYSQSHSISADGRYVAFQSYASNLVTGDTNNSSDVFVFDRQTRVIRLVSANASGTGVGNYFSASPSISADGRYVAFLSRATDLISGVYTDSIVDIFVCDLQATTNAIKQLSVSSTGANGNKDSDVPFISADGRYVSFSSEATNLVTGDTNGKKDIFVYDRSATTNAIQRVSVNTSGTEGDGDSFSQSISADGRYVAFNSSASNLVSGDTNGFNDVFVYDRQTGIIRMVSVNANGVQGDNSSSWPVISADGMYVAFCSFATNFVTGDTNTLWDIFVAPVQ